MTRIVLDIDDSQWKVTHLPRVMRTAESEWLNELACQVEIQVTDARPLIVLDLADEPTHVAYVVEILRAARHAWTHDVADQIEAQTKPARIPEPERIGARVAAADGGMARSTSTGPWTRFSTILISNWIDTGGRKRRWDDLIDPTLIREGVS